jgi:hypothetical protein
MNAAKVICSSLGHLFLNCVSTQSGVSIVLFSTVGTLLLGAALN